MSVWCSVQVVQFATQSKNMFFGGEINGWKHNFVVMKIEFLRILQAVYPVCLLQGGSAMPNRLKAKGQEPQD